MLVRPAWTSLKCMLVYAVVFRRDQHGPAWTSVKCMLVYAVVFRRDKLDVVMLGRDKNTKLLTTLFIRLYRGSRILPPHFLKQNLFLCYITIKYIFFKFAFYISQCPYCLSLSRESIISDPTVYKIHENLVFHCTGPLTLSENDHCRV